MKLNRIDSVLVANRGEIAVRVIRTAKELGLRTIAVYSELDRDALHVHLADEAWNIGPAPAAESYLNAARVMSVAAESNAGAIHPGYGFLSENAAFAEAVMNAGIAWVGPPPEAIRVMGDKISSRKAAISAGAPTVPGTTEPSESSDEVKRIAEEYGYPVAIKAAHGGGGKGLRVVHSADEIDSAFDGARREADAYFGNPAVYVEKYIDRPRHVEAQILVDDHGNELFLGERDCSVQRRHQKLIEETPSDAMNDIQRKALGEAALSIARICGYRNAGTVEFLLDQEGDFYFLEMNTRLQVEHCVTEMVTGIDLVAEQLRIADGQPVSITSVNPKGHAIEMRINAEDPFQNFLPAPGTVTEYREPDGFGVRVDGWVQTGTTVSQYYDNLMAKLIVWAPDRERAIARARRALDEYDIHGVPTTIPAHQQVLAHEDFVQGRHYTRWLEDDVNLVSSGPAPAETLPSEEDTVRRSMTVEIGGRRYSVAYWATEGPSGTGETRRKRPVRQKTAASRTGDGIHTAPMQGTIVKVSVRAGDRVSVGETICVLEAMKMENEVKAQNDGEVVDLRVQAGDTVANGEVIAVIR
ncbi:MAG TPA: acetyl-CoA carboxylase biotin carboxylase subunit [Acidimicrobiia bacterium]|nr:acetyl-CoA carboxylase biotin carboxylase subunit [Acidimicrobiia bacterium]